MKKKYKKFGHKATICSKKKKKLKTVIYDNLIGIITGKNTFASQKDLFGAKIRLCIGPDNTVIVRAVSILREGEDFKGDWCVVPIEPKKIKIMSHKPMHSRQNIKGA